MNLASRRQNRRAWFPRERYSDTVGRAGKVIWRHPGAKLTKVLVNVNIERSLGPVQVVTSTENSVTDLIKAAIEIYVEQQRRPLLKQTHHSRYQLHYSAYSLESRLFFYFSLINHRLQTRKLVLMMLQV